MVVYFRVVRSGIDKEVVEGKEGRAWEDKVGKGCGVRGVDINVGCTRLEQELDEECQT